MPDLEHRLVSYGAAKASLRGGYRPRVLITGACGGIGRDCAEALFSHGAELILCDKDAGGVRALADELGATGLYCDVASEAGVLTLVAEVLDQCAFAGHDRQCGWRRL